MLTCEFCGRSFKRKSAKGPAPRFCSGAHRTYAWRRATVAKAMAENRRLKAEIRRLRKNGAR